MVIFLLFFDGGVGACAMGTMAQWSVQACIMSLIEGTSLQKHSGMAHVVETFHSFIWTPTLLCTTEMNHTCLCLFSQSWSSFTDSGRMEGRVGLGTAMVNKQFAQDRYVTEITLAAQTARPHRTTGNAAGLECRTRAGFKGEGANWAVAQGPPQLRGLHTKI